MSESQRYSSDPRFAAVVMPPKSEVSNDQFVAAYNITDKTGVSQQIGVRLTLAEKSDTTIIRPMPITDEVGRIQLGDDQGVSRSVTNANIIGVDFPGMGTDTGPLTPTQVKELKTRGTFSTVGEAQWQAIEQALEVTGQTTRKLGRVVLWGTSLGGPQVAGLYAAKPEGVEISDVVFQMTPWETSLGGLLRGFTEAAKDLDYYYQLDGENYQGRESIPAWSKRIATARKLGSMARAVLALPKEKTILEDLNSRSLNGTRVHVMNAELDRISPEKDNHNAANHIRELGAFIVPIFMRGERHSIQQSRRVTSQQQADVINSW